MYSFFLFHIGVSQPSDNADGTAAYADGATAVHGTAADAVSTAADADDAGGNAVHLSSIYFGSHDYYHQPSHATDTSFT